MNRFFRICCLGLLLGLIPPPAWAAGDVAFSNRVNLALRQVGHHLLLAQQDSTSRVPPVEHAGDALFLLPLAHHISYDRLPALLEQAFSDYGITERYSVMLRSCESDRIVLGFNTAALLRDTIPCLYREQDQACVNLWLQFVPREPAATGTGSPLPWLLLPLLAGLGIWGYRKFAPQAPPPTLGHRLALGQFEFDPHNQTLVREAETIALTFRENKLLHLLARHPNQVLARADIQAQVWEEEGVIVGRSLDVFVSRLRKLLRADASVQIKSVHGVGYRLECP